MDNRYVKILAGLNACRNALDWAKYTPGTPEHLWNICPHGDWLIWIAARIRVDTRLVILAGCDCAETALQYIPGRETRPAQTIQVARAWCRGEATTSDLSNAVDTAYGAAADVTAVHSAAAIEAAYAAAYIVEAAYTAASSVSSAAAVEAAAYAAGQATGATEQTAFATKDPEEAFAPWEQSFIDIAHIVRERIPWSIINKILKQRNIK